MRLHILRIYAAGGTVYLFEFIEEELPDGIEFEYGVLFGGEPCGAGVAVA